MENKIKYYNNIERKDGHESGRNRVGGRLRQKILSTERARRNSTNDEWIGVRRPY